MSDKIEIGSILICYHPGGKQIVWIGIVRDITRNQIITVEWDWSQDDAWQYTLGDLEDLGRRVTMVVLRSNNKLGRLLCESAFQN